jgi:protein ImuB
MIGVSASVVSDRTQDISSVDPVAVACRKRIGWCNTAARESGVQIGMSEANAWSLSANLQIHQRDAAKEERALHEAALWALHFTPHVKLHDSPQRSCDGFLAEIQPSLGLFGGIGNLRRQLVSGVIALGFETRCAIAPTATGAWLVAQRASSVMPDQLLKRSTENKEPSVFGDRLDALPVHVLESAQMHLPTLFGIGCTTLGQLRSLPRAGLARRFGEAMLIEMDRAYGHALEAHRWFKAPDKVDLKLELPARVDNTAALLFAAKRLLMQLVGWLTARQMSVAGVTLWLHHESVRRRDHYSTPVEIVLATPSRDLDHLSLLLRERMAHVLLAAPVIEISLIADRIITQAAPNTELFPTTASDTENIGKLVERLQSRLGDDAVKQLAVVADHRPEKNHTVVDPGRRRSTKLPVRKRVDLVVKEVLTKKIDSRSKPEKNNHLSAFFSKSSLMRPTWLLSSPLALSTYRHKPFYQGQLLLLAGPERIEAGWWDDALAVRDYFIAENERHALLWIFRLRPNAGKQETGWFLHGFFA